MNSLHTALGGDAGLDKIVQGMYTRILADRELAPFFARMDMSRQHAKFRAFLHTLSGGPAQRSGIELRAAHSRAVETGLTPGHVDRFVSHFEAAMLAEGHENGVVREAVVRLERLKADVLGF